MDEVTYAKRLAKEILFMAATDSVVAVSTDERVTKIYEWCKSIYAIIDGCSGNSDWQRYHSAVTTGELLLNVGYIEETGEFMSPHQVDTILNVKDKYTPLFFYSNNNIQRTVTIDIAISDTVTKKQIKHNVWEFEPLVIQLQAIATPDDGPPPESETGIVLSK